MKNTQKNNAGHQCPHWALRSSDSVASQRRSEGRWQTSTPAPAHTYLVLGFTGVVCAHGLVYDTHSQVLHLVPTF